MSIATHVIKIKGSFDKTLWKEKELEQYVVLKIENQIQESFNADLDLLEIKDDKIEIWVLIFAYPSEVKKDIISKWICDNIIEKGLKVDNFTFEVLVNLTERDWRYNPFVTIPMRYKGMKMEINMGKLKEINKDGEYVYKKNM
jgi:hypothetical protein